MHQSVTLETSIWGGFTDLGLDGKYFNNLTSEKRSHISHSSSSIDFDQRAKTTSATQSNDHEKFYIDWIEALIALKGGEITDQDLRKQMKYSNQVLFSSIEEEFGGVIHLLLRHPLNFMLTHVAKLSRWKIVSLKNQPNRAKSRCSVLETQAYELQVEPDPNWKSRENDSVEEVIIEASSLAFDCEPSQVYQSVLRASRSSSIDEKMVDRVIDCSVEILTDASNYTLKAVELANTLRARLGTSVLGEIRDYFGGLLCLLEKYPDTFNVQRIPKSDVVSLKCGNTTQNAVIINDFRFERSSNISSRSLQSLDCLNSHKLKSPNPNAPEFVPAAVRMSHENLARRIFGLNQHIPPHFYLPITSCSVLLPNKPIRSTRNAGRSVQAHPRTCCPVLRILTSERCVPTKAWSVNERLDAPYVEVMREQLQLSGGATTISKLRGLVRVRLNLKETIKSVPLKAFLKAYSSQFLLNGNQVFLSTHLTSHNSRENSISTLQPFCD